CNNASVEWDRIPMLKRPDAFVPQLNATCEVGFDNSNFHEHVYAACCSPKVFVELIFGGEDHAEWSVEQVLEIDVVRLPCTNTPLGDAGNESQVEPKDASRIGRNGLQ